MTMQSDMPPMELEGRELEGSLRTFKFPGILQFLSMGRMTGVLRLNNEGRQADLSFRDGKIVDVSTGERYMRLGQMLISSGKVTAANVEAALEDQEAGAGRYLGELLLERNQITLDDLRETIALQFEEEIWEFFSWESGSFRFDQVPPRQPQSVVVELDVGPILKEGQRRMEEWQVLCQSINRPSEVMSINPQFSGRLEQPLDEKTWRVLSLVNGRLPVDAVVRSSTLGKFETYWSLDRLLRAEILQRGPSIEPARELPSGPGASFAAPSPEPAAEAEKSAGVRGFLGRKKGKTDTPVATRVDAGPAVPPPPRGSWPTDVSLVCDLVNATAEALGPAMGATDAERNEWMAASWLEIEPRHARADVLEVRDGRIEAGAYDRIARAEGELTRPLAGIRKDCLLALRALWGRMASGPREETARRVVDAWAASRAEIASPEFSLRLWRDEGLTFAAEAPNS